MATNTRNGKAFEYACAIATQAVAPDAVIVGNAPYRTAEGCFCALNPATQQRYREASETAVRMICGLEPMIQYGEGQLRIELATDARGQAHDVRDVLLFRRNNWQIGFSCKHNHAALKHPRITRDMDFGNDWIGVHCSNDYMAEMRAIIGAMDGLQGLPWNTLTNKFERFYIPILNAYRDEIERLCTGNEDAPEALIRYFFGTDDFYKVIMHESERTTTVEGFQINGTLGQNCGRRRPINRINRLVMPTRLIEATRVSTTTNNLVFDNGWQVSMRLHNKDSVIKPTALAWDVQLIGLPPSVYVNTRSWFE